MRLLAKPSLIAASLLCVALPSLADSGQDLIAARDAFRQNDAAALTRLAGAMQDTPLGIYPRYWLASRALDTDDTVPAQTFMRDTGSNPLSERLANAWLLKLGKAEDWDGFARELPRLPEAGRDKETQCYAQTLELRRGGKTAPDAELVDDYKIADGCQRLIEEAATRGLLSRDTVRHRVRLLLANNYLTAGRRRAAAAGMDDEFADKAGSEAALVAVVRQSRSDLSGAAAALDKLAPQLTREQAGFGWAQLAGAAARRQQMDDALAWFPRAASGALTPDLWEWWMRAALRKEQWATVDRVGRMLPERVASRPSWGYWRARALLTQDKRAEANALLATTGNDRGYYGQLAREELGASVGETPSNTPAAEADIARLTRDAAVSRALALFYLSERYLRADVRDDARREWRWAMRGRSDADLIAAAELARRNGFFEMAIYSAERTREAHNFDLRYLTPYKNVAERYARQLDIDPAWVYGLIRQESRFVTLARSGVGASGLMQLMPATARWVAGKMGLKDYAVGEVESNIQLGTWYLRYVYDKFDGQMAMATAAYNAGPNRASAWRDARPLEGAIYAETIPFDETRDYVQKVMGNATYYAGTFGQKQTSLKRRLGTVPARN